MRRTARALRAASSAAEAEFDAYDSTVVLQYENFRAMSLWDAVRARRASNHDKAVRVQARGIAKSIRAVAALFTDAGRSRRSEESEGLSPQKARRM